MELLTHTAATPVRLTRKTIVAIVSGVKNQQAILDNPNEFATIAANVIREKLEEQLVLGIQYERDGTWYEQSLFVEEFGTQSSKVMDSAKSLYGCSPSIPRLSGSSRRSSKGWIPCASL